MEDDGVSASENFQFGQRIAIAIVVSVWSAFWAPQAASAEGRIATGYFVDCNAGDDGASGTSAASPWRTLNRVNSAVSAAGSDVWIKAGSTCSGQSLKVDWRGISESDPVIIGSYYVDGAQAYQGYVASTRATIQGSYRRACRVWPSKCAWNTAGNDPSDKTPGTAVPSSRYGALVFVNRPYVTIQDLALRDSAGYGVVFDGFDSGSPFLCTGADECDYFWILQGNLISYTAEGSMAALSGRYMVIRNNEMEYGDLQWHDGQGTGYNWANGIHVGRCYPCYALIENNYVHDQYGEGIGPYGTSVVLVRGNRVANARSAKIYSSGGRVVVEQNTLVGGTVADEAGLGDQSRVGDFRSGLAFAREPASSAGEDNPEDTTKQLYRNNLIAGNISCIVPTIVPPQDVYRLGGRALGNTCIVRDGVEAVSYTGDVDLTAPEGIRISNNLFASPAGAPVCTSYDDVDVTFDHNYWVGTPASRSCRSPGTGDVYGSYAGTGIRSSFSFATADKNNFPSYTEFAIDSASDAARGGSPVATNYLVESDWRWVLSQRQWLPSCQSTQTPIAVWVKALATDYCGRDRNPGSMGALNGGTPTDDSGYRLSVD